MIVKKIQYHDLDGDLREDDFYFSMNETQFARINRNFRGGLQEYAARAAKDKNTDDMFYVVDTLVREAYGERLVNGFVKTAPNGQKLADFFVNTEAYDNLMIELMQSEDNFVSFMTGCLNQNAKNRVQARWAEQKKNSEGGLTPVGAENNKPALTVVEGKK